VSATARRVETVIELHLQVTAKAEYDPGSPAPVTNNHDSKAFSNPGEPESFVKLTATLDLSWIPKSRRIKLWEQFYEHGHMDITELVDTADTELAHDAIREQWEREQ